MSTSTAKPNHARALALVQLAGYSAIPSWGPLWHDPAYVLTCLRRYLASEGHSGAMGRSVDWLASALLADPYAGSGEELNAVACLLTHGKGGELV